MSVIIIEHAEGGKEGILIQRLLYCGNMVNSREELYCQWTTIDDDVFSWYIGTPFVITRSTKASVDTVTLTLNPIPTIMLFHYDPNR